jgi:mono/diheme cytochrome c family protein
VGIIEKQAAITLITLLVLGTLGVGYALAEPSLRLQRGHQMTEELAHKGQKTFESAGCVQCHLANGYGTLQGGAGWPLNTTQNQRGSETELENRRQLLARTLIRGRQGTPMAAYAREEGGPLNTEQINALVAYIQHGTWPTGPVEGEAAKLVQGGGGAAAAGGSQGAQLFASQGCAGCHQLSATNGVGPGLGGIATRAAERKPGTDAKTYLRESITQPSAFVVQGFQNGIMPGTYGQSLKPEEIDALVDYMLELK